MLYLTKLYGKHVLRNFSTNTKATASENALDYCANIVRQHDYENFLATLLMTKSLRSPALVVRAFNVEIARIQDQTSDPQTAAFRLQFWHDTLKTIFVKRQSFENIPANPVAQELFKICSHYNLPKRQLEKLILSRREILNSKYFRTLEEIEKYVEDSVSPIYYLILNIAQVADVHADHAASHLGKAQGLANILRSIHVSNHHKTVNLPMDILMKNKVSQEMILRGLDTEDIRNAVFEIASRANSHLEKARNIEVPKITHQIFLPAIAIDSYLKKLQKNHFNVFDKSLQTRNPVLPLNFYLRRILNQF